MDQIRYEIADHDSCFDFSILKCRCFIIKKLTRKNAAAISAFLRVICLRASFRYN